jgi:hypothetical protein
MKIPTLPAENTDLISLVKERDRRFLLKWLISTALLMIPTVAFFKPAANLYGIPLAILLALGFVVLPFIFFGGIEWVTDRGFAGTVEDMDFSVRIEMHDSIGISTVKGTRKGKHRHHSAGQANYCKVTVCTDEGTAKTLTLRLPGDSEAFPLRIGDRIVKYRGLPSPAVVGCKTPLCTACGNPDDDGKVECRSCGCSLIVLPLD